VADIPNRDNLSQVSILSNTRQDVKSFGFDANVGLLVAAKNVVTVGMDFFRDHSRDTRTTMTRVAIIGQGDRVTGRARFFPTPSVIVPGSVSQPQRVPISNFRDYAFFVEDEFELNRWLRLLGSFRVDRINVETVPTPGYVPRIPSGDPPFDPTTFPSSAGDSISRDAFTGNFGLVVRPNDVLSFTARIGRSFRHPNLEELLFFGPATIGAIVPNVKVKPERGVNIDIGAKVRTSRFAGEITYFNNTFTNFISTEIVTVARDDVEFANGSPISQAGNFLSRLRIQGLEGSWEVPISYRNSVFTWYGNMNYLHGEILQGRTALRTTTGIREVEIDGAPADNISPFKSVLGMRWNDNAFRYWWEYNVRTQTRVNRVSPFILASPFLIAQDLFGLYGFSIHTARAGYNFNREHYTLGLSLGIENLGNKFYREHFQFAPARGRSFTVGVNYRFF
jgi:hemoglobin/transferrin/lactoferrin receptor protein